MGSRPPRRLERCSRSRPQLSDERLKRLVRKAQAERIASVRQIREMLDRANGHRATKRLAAITDDGPAPTYSGHEDVVLDLLLDAGFEHPDVNVRLIAGGVPYYPDLRWPAQRVILEIDSAWHDGRVARELDDARQAALEAAGERVLRTSLEQAIRDTRQLVARLAAAGAPRALALAWTIVRWPARGAVACGSSDGDRAMCEDKEVRALPDLGTLDDEELIELLRALETEEHGISHWRRMLHRRIDAMAADLVERERKQHADG